MRHIILGPLLFMKFIKVFQCHCFLSSISALPSGYGVTSCLFVIHDPMLPANMEHLSEISSWKSMNMP